MMSFTLNQIAKLPFGYIADQWKKGLLGDDANVDIPGAKELEEAAKGIKEIGEALMYLFKAIVRIISPQWISHKRLTYRTIKVPATYGEKLVSYSGSEKKTIEDEIESLRKQLEIETNQIFRQSMQDRERELSQKLARGKLVKYMVSPETTKQEVAGEEEDVLRSFAHTMIENGKLVASIPLVNIVLVLTIVKWGLPATAEIIREVRESQQVLGVRKS